MGIAENLYSPWTLESLDREQTEGIRRTYLLIFKPGYTRSVDHTPPALQSLDKISTCLNPSSIKVWALMMPAAPEPITAILCSRGSTGAMFQFKWAVTAANIQTERTRSRDPPSPFLIRVSTALAIHAN
jgi:hypothetical protein